MTSEIKGRKKTRELSRMAPKKALGRVHKFYSSFFSSKRRFWFKIAHHSFKALLHTLAFAAMLVLPNIVTLICAIFIVASGENANIDIAADVFLGIGSACVAMVASLAIALVTSEEFFKKKDLARFIWIEPIPIFSNMALMFQSIAQFIIGLCFMPFWPITSVLCFSMSIIFAVYLLARFLIYKAKSKYDRYFYYLENTGKIRKTPRYKIIEEYSLIMNYMYATPDKKNVDAKTLNKCLFEYFRYAFDYLNILETMMKDEENVINEQNIIEKFLLLFSEKIETPAQLLCLFLTMKSYCETVESAEAQTGSVKSKKNRCDIMGKCLGNAFQGPLKRFCSFRLNLGALPLDSLLEPNFKRVFFDESKDIVLSQTLIHTFLVGMVDCEDFGLSEQMKSSFCKQLDNYQSVIDENVSSWEVFTKHGLEDSLQTIASKE